jgi:hypothetical protein
MPNLEGKRNSDSRIQSGSVETGFDFEIYSNSYT